KLKLPLKDQLILEYMDEKQLLKLTTGSSQKHLFIPCNRPVKIYPGTSRNTMQIEAEFFQDTEGVAKEMDERIEKFSQNLIATNSENIDRTTVSKYSLQSYIQEITSRYFQYNGYSAIEVYNEQGYKVLIKTTIFSYDDFYSDLYRKKLRGFLAELAHIKFHFSNLTACVFKLFQQKSLAYQRKNYVNGEEISLIDDLLPIIIKLNNMIEVNEDEFRKTNRFRVRPGYGYDDFNLDHIDGSSPHSLQSLVHHMMFEEDIFYPYYLNDEQIEQLAFHIEMYPYKLFAPSSRSHNASEIQKMLDTVYAECVEFVAVKLFSKGFDVVDVYAQYLSDPMLDRIAAQCAEK
ncbi:MAG: hypothetical protein ACLFQS_07530, partial [Bacteroidales bacterium]